MKKSIKISVITVCWNAETTIERTLLSIVNQTVSDFEYIIIDGKSQDNTMSIIKKYEMILNEKIDNFKCISESDNGLYDAMNKGAKIAEGKWLLFLNADDEFYDNQSLENAEALLEDSVDILYGNTMFNHDGKTGLRKSKPIGTITNHLPFIPQSAFVKTIIQQKYQFNTKYRIAADYDCFLRMFFDGKNFVQTNNVFSIFYSGGVSNQNEWNTYKEDIKIKGSYNILNEKSIIQKMKSLRRFIMTKLKMHNYYI